MPQISHAHVSTALHHCSQYNSDLRLAASARRELRSQLDSWTVGKSSKLSRLAGNRVIRYVSASAKRNCRSAVRYLADWCW